MTNMYKTLLGGGAALAMMLAGCSTSGAMRVAGIGEAEIGATPGTDDAGDGTIDDGEPGNGDGVGNTSVAATTDADAIGLTGRGGQGQGGQGGSSGGGGGSTGSGDGTGLARPPSLTGTVLVTAGNAVLTGSATIEDVTASAPLATVRGTVTQLFDRTGAALVDLGNGQSAVIQQAGAAIGSLINVSTPAGALLPGAGQGGAVGIAVLAPDPAVGTVAAVSVLPTGESGQLATAILSGTPLTSAITATGGAIATVGEVVPVAPAGLVAANVAGVSVGGAQPLLAVNVLSPTEITGTLATATVLPITAAPVTTIADATQAAGAVATPLVTAIVSPIAPPATVVVAPAVAITSVVAAPVAAVAPPVTATVAATVAVTAPVAAVTAPVTAPVTAVIAPVVAPVTGVIGAGLSLGGGLIH